MHGCIELAGSRSEFQAQYNHFELLHLWELLYLLVISLEVSGYLLDLTRMKPFMLWRNTSVH